MRFSALLRAIVIPCVVAFATLSAPAQNGAEPDSLFKTIQSLDAQLFDAYNHCELNLEP